MSRASKAPKGQMRTVSPLISTNYSRGFTIEHIGPAAAGTKCNQIIVKRWTSVRGAEWGRCDKPAENEYLYSSSVSDPTSPGRTRRTIRLQFLRCTDHLPEVTNG